MRAGGVGKMSLKVSDNYSWDYQSQCIKKTHVMLVGFLNKQLKQLQDGAECEEDNTI